MNNIQPEFEDLRPYLLGLAYRVLGSRTDAEDAVQDTWIRLQGQKAPPDSLKAWLTRVCTNICLDKLRKLKHERQCYDGPWLPDPLYVTASHEAAEPELAESLQLAYMLLLERLTPAERASLLLHDVFGFSFAEVGGILKLDSQSARQHASRARKHLKGTKTRFDTSEAELANLANHIQAALTEGDVAGVIRHLASDVELWADGGGKALAARNVITGPEKVTAFFMGIFRKSPAGMRAEYQPVNGQPSIRILDENNNTVSLLTISCNEDGQINYVMAHRNPDKLLHINSPSSLI